MAHKRSRTGLPVPPTKEALPLIHAGGNVARWVEHYWKKLRLPAEQAYYLAVTDDRGEFYRWTGRRLNSYALGCYCYYPLEFARGKSPRAQVALTGGPAAAQSIAPHFATPSAMHVPTLWDGLLDEPLAADSTLIQVSGLDSDFRHIIFVEPGMHPDAIEVTVAHELIHLADRVQGRLRRHQCHGRDAISRDEAALTGRDIETLATQLEEETERRRRILRQKRPYRYVYYCRKCGFEYPRVVKARKRTSCGRCDSRFNRAFELACRPLAPGEVYHEHGPAMEAIEQS